jgi:hypothetical protein
MQRVSVLGGELRFLRTGQGPTPDVEYTARYFTDVVEKFLDVLDLRRVLLVGESIGASIGRARHAKKSSACRRHRQQPI